MDRTLRRGTAIGVVGVGLLMTLGVYTAATGAGLTCAGRWPLCDGLFGLFPANWASFIEWFHRLVAVVVGLWLIGLTAFAFRREPPRLLRGALIVAVVLLPTQIVLGALTVREYAVVILLAHFVTATGIFAASAVAAAVAHRRWLTAHPRLPTVGPAVAVVPMLLLTPHLLVAFTPAVQVGYYLSGLAALGLTIAGVVGAGRWDRDRWARVGAALVLAGLLIVGRLVFSTPRAVAVFGVTLAVGALLVGTAGPWLPGLGRPRREPS
jgi:cytochrome c oxidase assembly protein subunit 15